MPRLHVATPENKEEDNSTETYPNTKVLSSSAYDEAVWVLCQPSNTSERNQNADEIKRKQQCIDVLSHTRQVGRLSAH